MKKYGDFPFNCSFDDHQPLIYHLTKIEEIPKFNAGETVRIRARISKSIRKGKCCFLRLREGVHSILACFFATNNDEEEKEMVQYIGKIPPESIVEIVGKICDRKGTSSSTTTNESISHLEVTILELYCKSRSDKKLPIGNLEDCLLVSSSNLLEYRYLSLRHSYCQEIFKLQSLIGRKFCEFMYSKDFTEIHTPKIVQQQNSLQYTVDYFGKKQYLSQNSELYQQLAIHGGLERVFEIGPSFSRYCARTNRHLNECTQLGFGMVINSHYREVIAMVQDLLTFLIDQINDYKGIETIKKQHLETYSKVKVEEIIVLTMTEVQELLQANCNIDIVDELTVTDSRLLSHQLRNRTDIVIVENNKYNGGYFEMPNVNGGYNNFSIIMRGLVVGYGCQYIHDETLLRQVAPTQGCDYESLSNALKYGAFPCGGCFINLEIFLMQFLGLTNIRHASLFPRDADTLYCL